MTSTAMATFVRSIARAARVTGERWRGRRFRICHSAHEHDRIYTENVCASLGSIGVACEVLEFETPGQNPALAQCLDQSTIAILGFNSQLDHCWIGDDNFVELAAKHDVPVIQWILDHPSSRWPEFTHSTAANSRFLFMSELSERYFRRFCLTDARTAWVAGHRPNRRSHIDRLLRDAFLARSINCLVALNLRRVGGTIEDAKARMQTLEPGLAEATREAVELARFDLSGALDPHLTTTLARRDLDVADSQFHFCFQIVDETVQIWRRLKIFEVAARFPVLIQTDIVPQPLLSGAAACFSGDPHANSMPNTIARMTSCRAVCNANYANDMIHDRTQNGLSAGCVVIVEDTPTHRRLFTHGENALLFRYDDDSLAECFDLVCNRPDRAFDIARAGHRLRRHPAIRVGGLERMLELAW